MIQRIGLGDFPRRVPRRKPAAEFAMFDSVNVAEIPVHAVAAAGYVNGHWRTYDELVRQRPRAKHLSIAVSASADARCLDVERYDATPQEAPAWVRRQIARGVALPVVYSSVSSVAAVCRELDRAKIRWRKRSPLRGVFRQPQVLIWSAHDTGRPHRCSRACGFGMPTVADATQWTFRALGQNLDESLCAPWFL